MEKNKKHIWKIKILESHKNNNSIIIGLAPENFDINNSKYTNCGWYLCCCCGLLFSGEPHNYKAEKIVEKIPRGKRISKLNEQKNLFDFKSKSITLIMDMNRGSLKYVIDSQRAIEIYTNIPTDKQLYPIVFLKYKGDKVIVTDNNWPKFIYQKIIKIQKKEKKDLKINNDANNKYNINNIKENDKIEKEEFKKSYFAKIKENNRSMRGRRGFRGARGIRPRGRGCIRGRPLEKNY